MRYQFTELTYTFSNLFIGTQINPGGIYSNIHAHCLKECHGLSPAGN